MTSAQRIAKGLWWNHAWPLVEGCSPVSAACEHCWAAQQAHMRSHQANPKMQRRYGGLTTAEGKWNGCVRFNLDELCRPAERNRPTVYALWNDLFHPSVTDFLIEKAFAIMTLCTRHTFVILTKRIRRMRTLLPLMAMAPLLNVYLGVTAENDHYGLARLPYLMQLGRAGWPIVLSAEPLLGPLDVVQHFQCSGDDHILRGVIVGGETGRHARPMHGDWVRRVRDDCEAAGVPFFLKNWGTAKGGPRGRLLAGRQHNALAWNQNDGD